jgi:Ion channel
MKLGWPELVTVAITFTTVVAVVLLHYEGLSLIGRTIRGRAFHHRAKILALIFAQLSLHILEIWMFALAAFLLTQWLEFGAILPVPSGGFLDFVYFSAITYTTVGFGDFVPAGPVRFLAGTEALSGFVLITWSASFTFLEMQRYWDRD